MNSRVKGQKERRETHACVIINTGINYQAYVVAKTEKLKRLLSLEVVAATEVNLIS